jgi:hypothetical protein
MLSLMQSISRMMRFISLIVISTQWTNVYSYIEDERVAEYHKRNYTYRPNDLVPNTTGWRKLMYDRLDQVEQLTDPNDRYEGFFQTIHSAMMVPNFTEYGFGLAKCPDDLLEELQTAIHEGLPTATYEEEDNVIEGPEPPWFISRPDLLNRVLLEMQGYTEEWVGFPLVAHQAYGFRVYRNESQLHMHVDQLLTHIISFILHIDSSDDAEPWPIYIEDFHGQTHEVTLTPGDILFYESSKCFHGRPKPFNGTWYTSVFVHYYPQEGWIDLPHEDEAHYAVPPIWNELPEPTSDHQVESTVPKLEMVETAMREPHCPNKWCRTMNTISWGGPAEDDILITPAFERIPFNPVRYTLDEVESTLDEVESDEL